MVWQKIQINDPTKGLIFMGLFALFQGAVSTYVASMITTIEKRFSLSSYQMGLLMGANDIGYLSTVILVGHFGSKKGREPIMLFLSTIVLWLSAILYIFPYMIYGARYNSKVLIMTNATKQPPCMLKNLTSNQVSMNTMSESITPSEKGVTMMLMMFAGILNGIGSTPFWSLGISYLDDMAGEKRIGIYMGVLFGIRSFAPIVGFLFGSAMSNINEDLSITIAKYPPGQKDPKWIGAWWLGWLILGTACLFTGPFMGLLKAKEKDNSTKEQKLEMVKEKDIKIESSDENIKEKLTVEGLASIKDIYRVFKAAFTNKIYLCLMSGLIFDILGNICLYVFFTKYLQFHFRASTSQANIMSAVSLSGTRLFSSLLSGIISRVFPMNIRQMNRFVALTNTISGLMFPILIVFSCPSSKVYGLDSASRNITCATKCNCQNLVLKPVCYNSSTWFSSCSVGCISVINETVYGGCGCNNNMFATKGFCEQMCPSMYYFLLAFGIIKIINSCCIVQFMTLFLRLCDPRDKAVYMSLCGMIFGICGLAFPPLAGVVIDSACVFRNTDSYGAKSNCLNYDNDFLRYLILGVAFVFQIPSCGLYITSWLFTPSNYRYRRPSVVERKSSNVNRPSLIANIPAANKETLAVKENSKPIEIE